MIIALWQIFIQGKKQEELTLPHNVLISKIRCGNPNKKSTAIHNKNNFLYIGTREGTDLTPLEEENTEKFEKEMAKPEDYIRYIAKRPHSHGLFGNIPLDDIDNVSKNLYKLISIFRITVH